MGSLSENTSSCPGGELEMACYTDAPHSWKGGDRVNTDAIFINKSTAEYFLFSSPSVNTGIQNPQDPRKIDLSNLLQF